MVTLRLRDVPRFGRDDEGPHVATPCAFDLEELRLAGAATLLLAAVPQAAELGL